MYFCCSFSHARCLWRSEGFGKKRMKKKKRARNSSTVVTGSSTAAPAAAAPCQSTELHLAVSSTRPDSVEAYYSMPWNSESSSCSDHQANFGDPGFMRDQEFLLLSTETDTEDCEDGERFVVEAAAAPGDVVTSSTPESAWEAAAAGWPETSLSPRARIQLFRQQISGKVTIPETWPGEEKLKDWACHSDVEDALRPLGLMLATASLVKDSLSRHV